MSGATLTVVRDLGAEDGQALLPVRSATTEGVRGGGALALPLAKGQRRKPSFWTMSR